MATGKKAAQKSIEIDLSENMLKLTDISNKQMLDKMVEINNYLQTRPLESHPIQEQSKLVVHMFKYICHVMPQILESKNDVKKIEVWCEEKHKIIRNNICTDLDTLKKYTDASMEKAENIEIRVKKIEDSISQVTKTIDHDRNFLSSLKKEAEESKKDELTRQINESSKSLIIRDLEPIESNERETPHHLKKQFANVLKELEIEEQVLVTDIYRLKTKNPETYKGKNLFLPVKVTFVSKFNKGLFLSRLKKLEKFKSIKVSSDIPPLLLSDYKRLDSVAFRLRSESKGTKTRIYIIGSKLALFSKPPDGTNFQELEIDFD